MTLFEYRNSALLSAQNTPRSGAASSDRARSEAPGDGVDSRATEFRAVEGADAERYSGGTLLVEAYAAIWLVLMAWIYLLWRKQGALAARLDGLEAALDRAAATDRAKPRVGAAPVGARDGDAREA